MNEKLLTESRSWLGTIKRAAIAFALSLSLLSAHVGAWAADPVRMVMGTDWDENTFIGKWYRQIYGEAFKRLGIPLELVVMPAKRLSSEVDEGHLDGELVRVYGYGSAHPNLVRVEESVYDMVFALYTANPGLRLNGLADLPATSLLGEYRRGVAVCENTLKRWMSAERLSDVPTTEQGLKKLLTGRTDLYCDLDITVRTTLVTPEFNGVTKIRTALNIGNSVPLYPYLHKSNASLAPRLAATLKEMKAQGLIDRYRIESEKEFGLAR